MGDSSDDALVAWLEQAPLAELIDAAGRLRDEGHGRLVSYSRKVFIPLTHLCRDVCHYCTFAERPRAGRARLSVAGRGARHRPRRRRGRLHGGAVHARRQAGTALPRRARGAGRARGTRPRSTISQAMCALVLRETGTAAARQSRRHERATRSRRLRAVSASQGVMLEIAAANGCATRAAFTYGSPDKRPAARLETMRLAANCACRSRPAF